MAGRPVAREHQFLPLPRLPLGLQVGVGGTEALGG